MKRLFLVLFLLCCWTTQADAATYYYLDCATGADPLCAANIGNDANTPCTNPASPCRTSSAARTRFNSAAAGDSVLLGKCGAWSNANMVLQNTNATASNRVTLGAYTPSWCVSGTNPILIEARASTDLIAFDSAGADGGYVVQDLILRGSGTGQYGIFTSQSVTDITFERLSISGFLIGVYCGQNRPRMVLRDSTIFDNSEQGTLWSCDQGSLIENNTFNNNGFVTGSGEDDFHYHNVYIDPQTGGVGITVRGNTLTDNSRLTNQCRSPSLVVHGQVDGLLIENNYIYQATTTMKTGCYGIAVDTGYGGQAEYFRNAIIRGNTVVNAGNSAIGCAGCVRPVIENNVVILEQPTGTGAMGEYFGITVPSRDPGPEDDADTGAIIRNNSVYLFWAPTDSNGINVGEYPSGSGSDLVIASNLIFFGSGVNSNHACFELGSRVLANFTAFVSNLCYHLNGNGRWSTAYAALANAQAAGFDAGGSAADPLIAATPSSGNGWAVKVSSGSPAINGANATYRSRSAIKGYPALSGRDMGAYEFGSNP